MFALFVSHIDMGLFDLTLKPKVSICQAGSWFVGLPERRCGYGGRAPVLVEKGRAVENDGRVVLLGVSKFQRAALWHYVVLKLVNLERKNCSINICQM